MLLNNIATSWLQDQFKIELPNLLPDFGQSKGQY